MKPGNDQSRLVQLCVPVPEGLVEIVGLEATLFNLSPHRRTVEGLTRSLGWPTVSILPLSGTNPEVVITVCWEISWYQYRIVLGSSQVRLAQRGLEPDDLDESFRDWNAELNEAGLVVPRLHEEERLG